MPSSSNKPLVFISYGAIARSKARGSHWRGARPSLRSAGLVERSPPPPVRPEAAAVASLNEGARKELDVARKLVAECGYHRRDEELAELDAVIAGARRFADLPPRV